VAFGSGFPFVQIYAPPDDNVIAIEPMTAPTNALVVGGEELPTAEPGRPFSAAFSLTVTDRHG
jgi:aldose 1-epimerase